MKSVFYNDNDAIKETNQGLRVSSAYDQEEHDMLDIAPIPFRAALSCARLDIDHSVYILAYEPNPKRDHRRNFGMPSEHLDWRGGTAADSSLEEVWLLYAGGKTPLFPDCVYGIRAHFVPAAHADTQRNKSVFDWRPSLRRKSSRIRGMHGAYRYLLGPDPNGRPRHIVENRTGRLAAGAHKRGHNCRRFVFSYYNDTISCGWTP